MEEKSITPKESLEIISQMIESTRQRFRVSDGNVLLMWGYLSIAVCLIVLAALMYTHNNLWNFLWFLIPAVGIPCNIVMDKKAERKFGAAKTYLEKLSSRLWAYLCWAQLFVAVVCIIFMLQGKNVWPAMAFFSFVNVGFAAGVFGMIIKMKSMTIGGFLSLASGIAMVCCTMAGVHIQYLVFAALFIVVFAAMFVIPGHILNHKAKSALK
ncbi:MAG: hypothetical protein HUK14_03750 [Muribaculaceae bacterium]|nr:hypothetical protein [Muribaculaceae bacterium]